MHADATLLKAFIFLLAIAVAVPLFNRLKLGPILAYLVAGAVLGPSALGLITASEGDRLLGELGVVMLLFLIGLELSPARLWLMRRAVFGVGLLQVAATTAVLLLIALAFGIEWRAALIAASALALSSTAFGVQLLAERKELQSAHGRTSLGVLLFQDVAVIPAVALLPVLAQSAAEAPDVMSMGQATLRAVLLIGGLVLASRFLVRPLFRFIASTRSVESFTATTLLVAIGTAFLTAEVGLSMSLGGFLAGLLLADTEFRHEIEANLEPFKGLLLGLFFIGVGMSVDWQFVATKPLAVVGLMVGLLVIKAGILVVIGLRTARLDRRGAWLFAALLAQGGEFAFILLTLASGERLVSPELVDLLTATVVLSMAVTPLLVILAERASRRYATGAPRPYDAIDPDGEVPRVVIAGFGRMGQIVARVLRAHRIPFTALENSVEQIDFSRRFDNKIYYGDPARPELLRAAKVDQAEVFVIAMDDMEAAVRIARVVRQTYPHLKVFARARNRQHLFKFMDLQLAGVTRETFHSSLVMTRKVLEALGVPPQRAANLLTRFREHDERLLRAQYLIHHDEAGLVQSTKDAMSELTEIFEADYRDSPLEPDAVDAPALPGDNERTAATMGP